MKNKVVSISAIWKPNKQESIEECAKNTLDFLLLLQGFDVAIFSTWFEKSSSPICALENRLKFDLDYLIKAFQKKYDERFPAAGSRISFWTGDTNEKSSAISFNLGSFGEKSFNKNICVIDLPSENDFDDKKIKKLMDLVSNYWKPDKLLINGQLVE